MNYPIMCTQKELKTIFGIPYARMTFQRKEDANLFPIRKRIGWRIVYQVTEVIEWCLKHNIQVPGPNV